MAKNKVACWSCGLIWEYSPPLGRGDSCSGCRRDAKVCLNCKFYDRHANRECLESQAELVKDKEKSNFCDWFESRSVAEGVVTSEDGNPLDRLFGKSGQVKEKSKFEDELEAFFKKK